MGYEGRRHYDDERPFYISDDLIAAFDDNDLRKQHYIKEEGSYYILQKVRWDSKDHPLAKCTVSENFLFRTAEAYLNLAEAILGNDASTTDPTALFYYNKVRTRAGMPTKATNEAITYEDLRYERRIELAFEGQYWYDLIRRSYYKQQEVVNYMNNQNRNASYDYNETTGKYEISEDYVAPGKGVATATASSLTLPVSDVDQNKNHYLSGTIETVPYAFGEREVSVADLYK